jgi:hypothetical protein
MHDFGQCKTSKYTTVRQIKIDPLSVVHPTPARGSLEFEGDRLGLSAALCKNMENETQCDETPLWVIKVVGQAQDVPLSNVCPLTTPDHFDVVLEFPRNKKALAAQRPRTVVARRGGSSVRQLNYDPSLPPFLDSLLAAEAGRWLPASFALSSVPLIKPTCWSRVFGD